MEALMKRSFMKKFMNPNKILLARVHRNTIVSCESKCRLHYDDLYDPRLKRAVDPSMKHVYLRANLQEKQTAFRTNFQPRFALGKQTAFRTNLQPMFALVKRERTFGVQSFNPRTYFTLPSFNKIYAAMKHNARNYFIPYSFRKSSAALEHNTRVFAAGCDPEVKCMETFIYTPIKMTLFTSVVGVKRVNVGRNHKKMFLYSVNISWLGRMEINAEEHPLHPYEKGSFCCLCNKEAEAP